MILKFIVCSEQTVSICLTHSTHFYHPYLSSIMSSTTSTDDLLDCADVYVCWPLARETAVALSMTHRRRGPCKAVVLHDKSKVLSDELVASFKGQHVVLLGSYYEVESVKSAAGVAESLTVYVFSAEDQKKYGDMAMVLDMEQMTDYSDWTWMRHLFHRDTAEEVPADEYFYRGLLFKYPGDIEKTIRNWMEDWTCLSGTESKDLYDEVETAGCTIVKQNRYLAEQTVKLNSIELLIGKSTGHAYKARLVISGPLLVMPVVKCAAEGFDIGINMRHQANGVTRFTFFTHKPEEVDLSFVGKAPFNGGGSTTCKGCGISRMIDVSSLDAEKWLESVME
jgi:hypothetical protein